MTRHLSQIHQEESVRRLSMLVAWNYETSFAPESTGSSSLFFTGRVLRLKLIRLNRHYDRFCTPELRPATILRHLLRESLTRWWKWRTREIRTSHSLGLFWAAKNKVTKENEHFSVRKISFLDLKEHFRQHLLFSAFVHPTLLFSHFADIFMVTKSRNWKQERSQVWHS